MTTETRHLDDVAFAEGKKVVADEVGLQFQLDGRPYEIDLSAENANKLRLALAPYITAARRAGGSARASSSRRSAGTVVALPGQQQRDRERAKEIRVWCGKWGIQVNALGRIPAAVIEAYDNRHTVTGEPAANERSNPELTWLTPAPPAPKPEPKAAPTATPKATPKAATKTPSDDELPPASKPKAKKATAPAAPVVETLKTAKYAASKEEFRDALRAWARENGITVSPRGLGLAPPVVRQFSAATGLLPPQVEAKTG